MERPLINATVIEANDQPLATWRGGTTQAIYAEPAETLSNMTAAQLWVGTATIERDGPYSVFANRMRIHLPMRGNGLQLHFQEPTETITLPTLEQATFPGDRPLTVTLLNGTVEAFNLIFQPTVQAAVRVIHLMQAASITIPQAVAQRQIFYMVAGTCNIAQTACTPVRMAHGAALVGALDEGYELTCTGAPATIIHTTIWNTAILNTAIASL